jgi:hypothetical protein
MLLGAGLLFIGRNREKIRSPTWLKVEKVQNLENLRALAAHRRRFYKITTARESKYKATAA